MTTKKLYKIKTKSILYEVFEVEAESYDKALDSIMPTIYDGTDDYPVDVERVGWWFDGMGKSILVVIIILSYYNSIATKCHHFVSINKI